MELNDKYVVKTKDGNQEVFMSMALILKLVAMFTDDLDSLISELRDPMRKIAMMEFALNGEKPRNAEGDIPRFEEYGITLKDGTEFYNWLATHVVNFTIQDMESGLVITEKLGTMVQSITQKATQILEEKTSSLSGSQA